MMRKFIPKKQSLEEAYTDYKVKDYINRYLRELQRHFNVSDKKMKLILYQVYRDLRPFDFIKKICCAKMQIAKFLTKEIRWR